MENFDFGGNKTSMHSAWGDGVDCDALYMQRKRQRSEWRCKTIRFKALQPSTRYGFSTGMKAQLYASIGTKKRNSDSLLIRPDTSECHFINQDRKRNNLHDSCSNMIQNAAEVCTTVQSTAKCLAAAVRYTVTAKYDYGRRSSIDSV
eukprot:5481213-Pleurochrysis_carterae.AAC.1